MTAVNTASRRTGRTVLWLFLGAFGVVFSVNMGLLYFALGSWPGLETHNAYAESLGFDNKRIAQESLHWVATSDYQDGDIVVSLLDGSGKPVALKSLVVVVGRATRDNQDREVVMDSFADVHRGATELSAGNWQVRIHATDLEGHDFRQIQSLIVR